MIESIGLKMVLKFSNGCVNAKVSKVQFWKLNVLVPHPLGRLLAEKGNH